jgi:hypothetical protein
LIFRRSNLVWAYQVFVEYLSLMFCKGEPTLHSIACLTDGASIRGQVSLHARPSAPDPQSSPQTASSSLTPRLCQHCLLAQAHHSFAPRHRHTAVDPRPALSLSAAPATPGRTVPALTSDPCSDPTLSSPQSHTLLHSHLLFTWPWHA